jgi:hypothetical protein
MRANISFRIRSDNNCPSKAKAPQAMKRGAFDAIQYYFN